MKTNKKGSQMRQCSTEILDIPENVFRIVFKYLEDDDIFFTLRPVCLQLKRYADEHIKLEGKFLLIPDSMDDPKESKTPFILYIFSNIQSVLSTCSKPFRPYSICQNYERSYRKFPSISNTQFTPFGTICSGRLILGNCCVVEGAFGKSNCYEYNLEKGEWNQSSSNDIRTCAGQGVVLNSFFLQDSGFIFHEKSMHLLELKEKRKSRNAKNAIEKIENEEPISSTHFILRAKNLNYRGIGNISKVHLYQKEVLVDGQWISGLQYKDVKTQSLMCIPCAVITLIAKNRFILVLKTNLFEYG